MHDDGRNNWRRADGTVENAGAELVAVVPNLRELSIRAWPSAMRSASSRRDVCSRCTTPSAP
jgi:hypothetical protein